MRDTSTKMVARLRSRSVIVMAEVKRLDPASRCYQLLAEKLPYDPSQELTVGFGNHVLKAHFSPERWPRIFVSYDGAITTMGKLPMVELELIIQAIKMLG